MLSVALTVGALLGWLARAVIAKLDRWNDSLSAEINKLEARIKENQ